MRFNLGIDAHQTEAQLSSPVHCVIHLAEAKHCTLRVELSISVRQSC